eukprot:CAMPEP_0171047786 /NCGR_PEP_ID=MMETSP0736-20130129/50509_1 /TAXON_ID=186038 /ORGANISM="Fragilariopsis kerguelensis, Strain L26-C5" /LENGTH=40 /DNA_ID= /DNA_START= /DNA_END= /DNA_ORIENTATION=
MNNQRAFPAGGKEGGGEGEGIWTYGTDYGLATTMTFLAYW